ncbi:MAG: transposase [Ginsengibacter sp.]
MCSQGKVLEYKSIKESHGNGNKMKQYRSKAKDCSACPLKTKCIGKSSYFVQCAVLILSKLNT